MRVGLFNLTDTERAVFSVCRVFLENRLEQKETIAWALALSGKDLGKRFAVLDVLDRRADGQLSEPWLTAWRLIEETWDAPVDDTISSLNAYDVRRRLKAGEKTGSLVKALVDLVEPRVKIEPFSKAFLRHRAQKARPKTPADLFSISLSSGKIKSAVQLGIADVESIGFLCSIANALEAAVARGLDIASRLGWSETDELWHLGGLNIAYFSTNQADPDENDHGEPDEFSEGIAPSVKLLTGTVSRIAALSGSRAAEFANRWLQIKSPIFVRLWATVSFDAAATTAATVADFLRNASADEFWDVYHFPEIAELRARRFIEFPAKEQRAILARIRKLPPKRHWPSTDKEKIEGARLFWAIRELRRIQITGNILPEPYSEWLAENLPQFEDLQAMDNVKEGFPGGITVRSVQADPDERFDLLEGAERLLALQTALASKDRGWERSHSDRASDWLRQADNANKILADLETGAAISDKLGRVWERFGWTHTFVSDPKITDEKQVSALFGQVRLRVLHLLNALPARTIEEAIDGISNWLSTWQAGLLNDPVGFSVWKKVWPLAVAATNVQQDVADTVDLDLVVGGAGRNPPKDLDVLNTPAGKMIGVFLASCPNLGSVPDPFTNGSNLAAVRDEIFSVMGRAKAMALYRFCEHLGYFLLAAPDWTQVTLVPELLSNSDDAIRLWRAVARRSLYGSVVDLLGDVIMDRALDARLDREARQNMVRALIFNTMNALKGEKAPSIKPHRLTQLLRSVEDEVRANAAQTFQEFVADTRQTKDGSSNATPESKFISGVEPFLLNVWPQERSLTTPGISRALADLPAASGNSFAKAVDVIERFLVPFECWTLMDYGLYGERDGAPKLSAINTPEKAEALLKLLDKTVGTSENAVIPSGIGDALSQIEKAAPGLIVKQSYRRLATVARRG